MRLPRNLTSRFTMRSPAKAFRSKSTSKDNISVSTRSFRYRLPPISENKLTHLPRNLSTPKIKSKALRLPRNLHIEVLSTAAPTSHTDFGPPKKCVFSLAPVVQSDHEARKRARRHNKSAVRRAPAQAHQIASLRSRNALGKISR